jgi:hypothetical protein
VTPDKARLQDTLSLANRPICSGDQFNLSFLVTAGRSRGCSPHSAGRAYGLLNGVRDTAKWGDLSFVPPDCDTFGL